VGSNDGKLYALDAATGAFKWSYTTGAAISSSPAIISGVVYVGSNNGKLYALHAATGAFKWSYTTGGPLDYSSPAVGWKGVLYVGSRTGSSMPCMPPPGPSNGAIPPEAHWFTPPLP